MKHFLIVSLLALLLTVGFLQAQEQAEHNFAVKLNANPLAWLLGAFHGSVEIKLNDALSIEPGFTYMNLWLTQLVGVTTTGYELTGDLNYYFRKKALSGLYVGPTTEFGLLNMTDDSTNISGFMGSVGARFGYQWIARNGFLFNGYVGYSLGFSGSNISGSATTGGFNYGLDLGWAF